jgi:hypothetical protein
LAGVDQIKALDLLIGRISSWRGNEDYDGLRQLNLDESAGGAENPDSDVSLEIALGSVDKPTGLTRVL